MFVPITDLFEFKFMIFNHNIKMIILNYIKNNSKFETYYDEDFNSIDDVKDRNYDISKFDKNVLNKMKLIAIKLSEDFKNFIRVDLYIFHNKIYLSELTFVSHGEILYLEILNILLKE